MGLRVIILGREYLPDIVKRAKLFQTLVDEGPGAVLVLVNLALALVGAAARPVEQVLGADGNGADAAGFSQHALPACPAALKPGAAAFIGA